MHTAIRVLLADHQEVYRIGLRALVEAAGMAVSGEARDGYDVLEKVEKNTPHLVIMDLAMPRLNGCEVTMRVVRSRPAVPVLGLLDVPVHGLVRRFLSLGGSGLLLKDCTGEELIQAARSVIAGETYLTPAMTTLVVRDYARSTSVPRDAPFVQLTDREREVLQLVAEGTSVKEIAERLAISVKTAHTHRQHINDKLGAKGVADLTRYALREGITRL